MEPLRWDGELLALDLSSTSPGGAVGRPGETPRLFSQRWNRPGMEPEDMFGAALGWWADYLRDTPPDWVTVEAPIVGGDLLTVRNPNTALILIGLYAIIAAGAKRKSIPFRKVYPSTVRAHFIGCGQPPKDTGKLLVRRRCDDLGWPAVNDDMADAAATWDWQVSILHPQKSNPASRSWHTQYVPQQPPGGLWGKSGRVRP